MTGQPRSDNPLAGTSWRLVSFQSMDDAIGTVTPGDPSQYTMRLDADGSVSMRLNCNRATGTWSVEPGLEDSSGRFRFGPLAMTRALCPPPSMDGRIAADAEAVRSYLLADGRLHLSLMVDSGIYTWEPDPAASDVPFETTPDPALEAAILRETPDYTRDIIGDDRPRARYVYGRVDLNDDGADEVFAYLLGPFFCGTGGCTLLLFTPDGDDYTLVSSFPISRLPVIVSPDRTEGWRQQFAESRRLPGTAEPEGTRCLTGEPTFAMGIPLDPGR